MTLASLLRCFLLAVGISVPAAAAPIREGIFVVGQRVTVGQSISDSVDATAAFEAMGVAALFVMAIAISVQVVKYLLSLIV